MRDGGKGEMMERVRGFVDQWWRFAPRWQIGALFAVPLFVVIAIALYLLGPFGGTGQKSEEVAYLVNNGCPSGTAFVVENIETGQSGLECWQNPPPEWGNAGYIQRGADGLPLGEPPQAVGVESTVESDNPANIASTAAAQVVAQSQGAGPTHTPPPPPPERVQLGSICATGEYLVRNAFPSPDYIGKRGYRELNELSIAGPEIQNKQYPVSETNVPGHIMVMMDTGAFFVPEFWFVATGETYCTNAYSSSFDAALRRLAPQQNEVVNLFDNPLFAMAGYILIAIMVAAPLLETILKQRLLTIPLFMIVTYVFIQLQLYVRDGGQLLLYIAGLLASIALGNRETLAEVSIVLSRRRDRHQIPDDLEDLLRTGDGLMKIVRSTDWSFASWWTGINVIWSVVGSNSGPLALAIGLFPSLLLNTILTMVFLGLEVLRRGQKGDVIAFIVGMIVGLAIAIEFVVFQSVVAVLITSLIGVILIMGIGFSGRTALSRESIPEALGGIATMGLGSAILLFTILG